GRRVDFNLPSLGCEVPKPQGPAPRTSQYDAPVRVDYAFVAEAADSQGGLFYVTRGGADIHFLPREFPKPLRLGAISFVVRVVGEPHEVGQAFPLVYTIVDADGQSLSFRPELEARFDPHPIDPTRTTASVVTFRIYGFPVPLRAAMHPAAEGGHAALGPGRPAVPDRDVRHQGHARRVGVPRGRAVHPGRADRTGLVHPHQLALGRLRPGPRRRGIRRARSVILEGESGRHAQVPGGVLHAGRLFDRIPDLHAGPVQAPPAWRITGRVRLPRALSLASGLPEEPEDPFGDLGALVLLEEVPRPRQHLRLAGRRDE